MTEKSPTWTLAKLGRTDLIRAVCRGMVSNGLPLLTHLTRLSRTDKFPGLSKSRITAFEQCPKKLWLSVNRKDLAAADPTAELRLAAGQEVGKIACGLFPEGVMIEADPDLAAAVERTRTLMDAGHQGAIFEATFSHEGVLVRVDVMEPDGAGGWAVAEVKSSTGVKDYHFGDLATQLWVIEQAGVHVSSAVIRHIDNRFVLEREGDYRGLFADAPLGHGMEALIQGRALVVAGARAVLSGTEPDVAVGDHCSSPFDCEFADYCNRDAPAGPEWPVALLPNTGRKLAAIYAAENILDLRDVPDGQLASTVHERIRVATLTGEAFRDPVGAAADTAGWAYPRAWLDFETIAHAAPRWIGTHPYQQIPFQFSCHIEDAGGQLTHTGYLSLDGADPRRACAEALVAACGSPMAGAVVAYNAGFERRCILALASAFEDLEAALRNIADRLVDLLPVARARYYHCDQRGSWSIKAVLPTVAPELAYGSLAVGEGMAAQAVWFEAVDPKTPQDRREEIRTALETYCARDTEAMIVLLRRLLEA